MWVLLLFEWRIMKYTYSAQPKLFYILFQCRKQFFKRKDLQILRGFRRDGEEVMEEVKYLLDVLIRNFCDSRVRDVRIEIERDAIAVDKICIHSCIVPVIILLREISGKGMDVRDF